MSMFCYQCQETANNTGCTQKGVCGKTQDVSNIQDVLIWQTKCLCLAMNKNKKESLPIDRSYNHMVTKNLFITITNANFDYEAILKQIYLTMDAKNKLLSHLSDECKNNIDDFVFYDERDDKKLLEKSTQIGVFATQDENKRSVKELVTYGIKGLSAYIEHARNLKKYDETIDEFIQETMEKLLYEKESLDDYLALAIKTGEFGVKGMALLDGANTSAYGNPQITKVNIGVGNNPAILISGHDLHDMKMLLEQTQGTGVDVYTHSEMLPAHYYPELKKYSNFIGNYGGAWHTQRSEFESFNGVILMTTNCIVPPKDSYIDRMYTTGAAGYDGCKHIQEDENGYKDFSVLIEHAKKCNPPKQIEEGYIVGGFAHNQVFDLADKVVDAVKSGSIKKFVVMAGCDGRQKGRNYYTEFAEKLPKNVVILTAGCAKYRYNKLNLGDIGGIPRILDAGQCNDSYSLAIIALKLKEIFELNDINDLPIKYNIAWYEQKAVIVLLALLYLGVKNIHLGPTLPAFLSRDVANVLVEKFGISGIGTVEDDLELFFK